MQYVQLAAVFQRLEATGRSTMSDKVQMLGMCSFIIKSDRMALLFDYAFDMPIVVQYNKYIAVGAWSLVR
jgi:hypothetical protein